MREIRHESRLSLRDLADAAGVAVSTVHRIERGDVSPTLDTLERIAGAAGVALRVEPRADHRLSLVGLSRCIASDLRSDPVDRSTPVRRAAEFVHRFLGSSDDERRRMIAARPPTTGSDGWDALVAAVAEWLAVRSEMSVPGWAHDPDRYLPGGWWVTDLPSMRAWEYAGSPMSFKVHGVYIHRDSLANV
ncbi:MAG TPA: helix-turn-helix transcriptional regulator [Acidimicrobiales bacterium]|nr:helix-turn-helix transcriptional regulator [Acidimicrobiales bacterium]